MQVSNVAHADISRLTCFISCGVYNMVRMIMTLSSRSRGMPCGEQMSSVPLVSNKWSWFKYYKSFLCVSLFKIHFCPPTWLSSFPCLRRTQRWGRWCSRALCGGTWSIRCPACAPRPQTARRVRARLRLGQCSGSPPCWSQHAACLKTEKQSWIIIIKSQLVCGQLVMWAGKFCQVFSTCDFCLFGLHQLSHHGENVLASLRSNNEELYKKHSG